jgi:hypothetical protein
MYESSSYMYEENIMHLRTCTKENICIFMTSHTWSCVTTGQVARLKRFASCVPARSELNLSSTRPIDGRAFQSGGQFSPNTDRLQSTAGILMHLEARKWMWTVLNKRRHT